MKNTKRILSVTIKRMVDDSPDTSWLGEYSDTADSEYAIDRAHSENCACVESNHKEAIDTIERAITHLNNWRVACADDANNTEWESLDAAIDLFAGLQDDVMECDCNGPFISSHEFRYFNGLVENYEGESAEDIRKYVRQDYDRVESLNNGDWCFLGIAAEASVQLTGDLTQTIHSGGLWGIESDSSKTDFEEVQTEQLSELRAELKALGFSGRAISAAFKNVEEKEA